MPKLTIDGIEVEVEQGSTVLQAIKAAGKQVPVFCYNDKLKIAGNCRMCLVELEGAPKPVASCAMPAGDNMVVKTGSEVADKARKGALEFLLANHPLDCPICDQGGECDLQDITMEYGKPFSRFEGEKRAVPNKDMGPIINTEMNRCIHCTRCIRFAEEIAGVPDLGAINRGGKTEITTYLGKSLASELSGNIVDLCPVGALTSKPYKYKARPWELKKTYSIDVMDATGSNIRVDSVGDRVLRVLPRNHEDINEDWISDKTRYGIEGLAVQRIDRPYIRNSETGKLEEANWDRAYETIRSHITKNISDPKKEIAAIAGDFADVESMLLLKELMNEKFGSKQLTCLQNDAYADPNNRCSYIFNSGIAGIDNADYLLIVGGNIRKDSPIINARIRKRYLSGDLEIARIGGDIHQEYGLTYAYEDLGDDVSVLEDILNKKTNKVAKKMLAAKRPMIIVSEDVRERSDAQSIMNVLANIADKYGVVKNIKDEETGKQESWNGFNVLHKRASSVGGLDIGFIGDKSAAQILKDTKSGKIKLLYLLGADELDFDKLIDRNEGSLIIYQGTHGDKGASVADVVLPAAAYTEKSATYVNTEGRVQRTTKAVNVPNHLASNSPKEDWKVIQDLSEFLSLDLGYANIDGVRDKMTKVNNVFAGLNTICDEVVWNKDFAKFTKVDKDNKLSVIDYDFYLSNHISRHSKTMQECSLSFSGLSISPVNDNNKVKTKGTKVKKQK